MQNIDETDIANKVFRLFNYMATYKNKEMKSKRTSLKTDLSDRQFNILIAILILNKNTVSQLSELMKISKSTVSIILSKMVKNGYLTKKLPNVSDDKRKIYFEVSKKGAEVLDKANDVILDNFKSIYKSFTDEQLQHFKSGIEKVKFIQSENELIGAIRERLVNKSGISEIDTYAVELAVFFRTMFEQDDDFCRNDFNINGNNSTITRNQFKMLVYIDRFKYNTISKLENFLGLSGSTVSITVSKLVEDGYLKKEKPSEREDGRIVYISVTEKGKNILIYMWEKLKESIIQYIKDLSYENKININDALDKFIFVFNYKNL